jgi:hypothetical protein
MTSKGITLIQLLLGEYATAKVKATRPACECFLQKVMSSPISIEGPQQFRIISVQGLRTDLPSPAKGASERRESDNSQSELTHVRPYLSGFDRYVWRPSLLALSEN